MRPLKTQLLGRLISVLCGLLLTTTTEAQDAPPARLTVDRYAHVTMPVILRDAPEGVFVNQVALGAAPHPSRPRNASGRRSTISTVLTLTVVTCPMSRTIYSGSAGSLGSWVMPLRLSSFTRY